MLVMLTTPKEANSDVRAQSLCVFIRLQTVSISWVSLKRERGGRAGCSAICRPLRWTPGLKRRGREAPELNEGFVPTWEGVLVCGWRQKESVKEKGGRDNKMERETKAARL